MGLRMPPRPRQHQGHAPVPFGPAGRRRRAERGRRECAGHHARRGMDLQRALRRVLRRPVRRRLREAAGAGEVRLQRGDGQRLPGEGRECPGPHLRPRAMHLLRRGRSGAGHPDQPPGDVRSKGRPGHSRHRRGRRLVQPAPDRRALLPFLPLVAARRVGLQPRVPAAGLVHGRGLPIHRSHRPAGRAAGPLHRPGVHRNHGQRIQRQARRPRGRSGDRRRPHGGQIRIRPSWTRPSPPSSATRSPGRALPISG